MKHRKNGVERTISHAENGIRGGYSDGGEPHRDPGIQGNEFFGLNKEPFAGGFDFLPRQEPGRNQQRDNQKDREFAIGHHDQPEHHKTHKSCCQPSSRIRKEYTH